VRRLSLLLLALAAAPWAPARLRPDRPAPAPAPRPELRVRVRPAAPPRGFQPLRDGGVVLLGGDGRSLLHVRGAETLADLPLRGAGFDPAEANLVDLALDARGRLLLLDALGGTVWIADLEGRIAGRFGLFVWPSRLARGADGAVYVQDAANACVTGFEAGAARRSYPWDFAPEPFATSRGEVPFLVHGAPGEATRIGLLRSLGATSKARELGQVQARAGLELLDTEVLGAHGDDLYVAVSSFDPARDQGPRAMDLWVFDAGGEGAPRVQTLPHRLNHCWDCGPAMRVGPAGGVWLYALDATGYRLYRLPRPEVRP